MIFTTETTENTEKVHVSSASALRPSQSATGCFTATHCRTVMIFTTEITENSEKVHNFVRVCVTSFLIGYRLLYRYVLLYCNDLYHRDHRELGECSCLSGSALRASQSATGCFTATHCRTVMIFTTETTENSEKVHISSASALRPSQSATGCFTGTICRCNARPPNSDGTIARAAIRAATRIATS